MTTSFFCTHIYVIGGKQRSFALDIQNILGNFLDFLIIRCFGVFFFYFFLIYACAMHDLLIIVKFLVH